MKADIFLIELENLKTRHDKIGLLERTWSEAQELKDHKIHKLKSALFIIANTYISGDPRDPQFIKMRDLISMAAEAIAEDGDI
jgi:hypothetical protein